MLKTSAGWVLGFLVLAASACDKPPPPPPPAWLLMPTDARDASWCDLGASADAGACKLVGVNTAHVAGTKIDTGDLGHAVVKLDGETTVELGPRAEVAFPDPLVHVFEPRRGVVVVRRAATEASGATTLRVAGHDAILDKKQPVVLAIDARESGDRATFTLRQGVLAFEDKTELHAGDTILLAKGQPIDRLAAWNGAASPVVMPIEEAAKEPRGIGTMTARVPGTEQTVAGVHLASHHVHTVVQGTFARTEIEEVFASDDERTLEGRYVFAVPARAVTARLALWVGDKLVEDEIVEKKRAAAIFKDVVDDTVRPRDPALLEWLASGKLSLKVFPIPPKGTRKVLLSYDEVVPVAGGRARYLLPLSLGAARANTIDDVAIDVTITEPDGAPTAVDAPGYDSQITRDEKFAAVKLRLSKAAPISDFVVAWRRPKIAPVDAAAFVPSWGAPAELALDRTVKAAGTQSYGAVRMTLGLPAGAAPPPFQKHDRVIIVDASQSQSKETLAAELDLAIAAVRALEPEERFAILACDSGCVSYPQKGLAVANETTWTAAETWAKDLAPGGSTDVAGALFDAAARADDASGVQIVYIGDGAPSAGELTPNHIAARVKTLLEKKQADVRLVGAGGSVDAAALAALAGEIGATVQTLVNGAPLSQRIDDITMSLRRSVVKHAHLKLPDTMTDAVPRALPNLVLGDQLFIAAKLSDPKDAQIEIAGDIAGAPWSNTFALAWGADAAHQSPTVPRFWAAQRIDDLALVHDAASDKESIALSKQFHVLSRLTSMLVLENDAMFAGYGIARTVAPDGTDSPEAQAQRVLLEQMTQLQPLDLSLIGNGGGASVGSGSGLSDLRTGDIGAPPRGLGQLNVTQGNGGSSLRQTGSVQLGAPQASVPISDLQRVIASLRPKMRACYNRGLTQDPTQQGKLVVRARVAPNGEVESADIASNSGLSPSVGACVTSVVKRAQFDSPGSSGSAFTLPLNFVLDEPTVVRNGASAPPQTVQETAEPQAATHAGDDAWRSAGDDAIAKLRAASDASPTSRAKKEALVRGMLSRGRFTDALVAARAFADADPDLPVARELLSYAAAANGDAKLALAAVDAGVETDRLSVKAHLRAARAFEAASDERRACSHWRTLSEIDPNEEWRYQALRCRARAFGDKDGALAEANAIEKPSKRISDLIGVLAGPAPAYDPLSTWQGQMEASVSCTLPAKTCPIPIVVAPNGVVFSPYTPADARSGSHAVAVTVIHDGTYRAMIVGGDEDAKGELTFRSAGMSQRFPFTKGGLQTLAASDVSVPQVWYPSVLRYAKMGGW